MLNGDNCYTVSVSAPGKVILHGEHSVVYGKTAIAVSLGLRSSIVIKEMKTPGDPVVYIHLPCVGLQETIPLAPTVKALFHPQLCTGVTGSFTWKIPSKLDHDGHLRKVNEFLHAIKPNFDELPNNQKNSLRSFLYMYSGIFGSTNVEVKSMNISMGSELTIGAGTGSSASFAVCLAGALLRLLALRAHPELECEPPGPFELREKEAISAWAYNCERIMHGAPSGDLVRNQCGASGDLVQEGEMSPHPEAEEPLPAATPPPEPPELEAAASGPSAPHAQLEPASDADAEPPLDPALLAALGESTSDTPEFGPRIHVSLSNIWLPLLKKGLLKENRDKLLKEYLIPNNCTLLQAPKLNAEISAAISDVVRGRDKKYVGVQQQLGQGVSAVSRGMDVLLKGDDKAEALRLLSDGCRLLSDLHNFFTKDRTKLLTPSLDKSFLQVIQDTERDESLFGNALAEKIKASKAIEKQGHLIKKNIGTPKASTNTTNTRPFTTQGNWSGPPRYPSNRGGRGYRRTNPPPTRRPYLPSAPPPPPARAPPARPRAPARPQ